MQLAEIWDIVKDGVTVDEIIPLSLAVIGVAVTVKTLREKNKKLR